VETGYRERRIGGRERECVVVLSGGELDGGRRVTMWVSPQKLYLSYKGNNNPKLKSTIKNTVNY